MKVYVVQNRNTIVPFEECGCECFIGGKKLATLQREIFIGLGIESSVVTNEQEIMDSDEYILVGDNVYFTQELFVEFVIRSQRQKKNTVCALKRGVTTERTMVNLQRVNVAQGNIEYNLRYLPARGFRTEDYVPVVINPDQFSEWISVPEHVCEGGRYSIPLTDRFIIQIDHWANLWAANVITTLVLAARFKTESKVRQLFVALKSCSFNKWDMLTKVNRIGRNCDIHPTAYVEGSIIEDNVRVGAGAVIKESIVGKGAFIGNRVVIEESVIGEKSTVLHGHILYSVFYPGVFSVAQMVSASLIGRNSFIASGATLTDFRLDGKDVTVLKEDVIVDSGSRILGCCLGHDVYLGSGCVVAPGRIVRNGLRLTLPDDRIFRGSGFELKVIEKLQ